MTFSIRWSPELAEARRIANRVNVPISDVIRAALQCGLPQLAVQLDAITLDVEAARDAR